MKETKNCGCNTVVECCMCEKVRCEVPSEFRKKETKDGSVSVTVVSTETADIDRFLQKGGWKVLFNHGFMCPNCYEKIKEDIIKIGFE